MPERMSSSMKVVMPTSTVENTATMRRSFLPMVSFNISRTSLRDFRSLRFCVVGVAKRLSGGAIRRRGLCTFV
jgi:hypothetical protein